MRRTETNCRRLITAITGFVVTFSTALFGAAAAHADPDPHIPDPANDYCPGSGLALKDHVGLLRRCTLLGRLVLAGDRDWRVAHQYGLCRRAA